MVDFSVTQWICLGAILLLALSHRKAPTLIGLLIGAVIVTGAYLG